MVGLLQDFQDRLTSLEIPRDNPSSFSGTSFVLISGEQSLRGATVGARRCNCHIKARIGPSGLCPEGQPRITRMAHGKM